MKANTVFLMLAAVAHHLAPSVVGFASSKQNGCKTRPVVSRLAPPLDRFSMKSSALESSRGDDNERWDPLRFVQQSSKFVTLPFQGSKQRTVQPGDVVWRAGSQNDFTMAPLDDIVMGGVSKSTFDDSTGLWTGTVTDANNGGFIGIRSTPAFQWDMSSCTGLEWQVRTNAVDAKRYKFVLRDSTDFNGVTWTTSADVEPGVTNPLLKLFPKKQGTAETKPSQDNTRTVRIPFDDLIPTIFARTVPDQTFRKDNVVGLQIAFSKFEYDGDLNPNFALGGVDLQILEIRTY